MSRLSCFNRYLFRQLTQTTLVVILVIAGLDLLFALLGEMEDLSENYHLSDALLFVAMTSPRQLYEVTPFCLLIGVLIGLGNLARQSEFVVMGSADVANWGIAWSACRPVLLFMVATTLLGEWVAPAAEQAAQNWRAQLNGDGHGRAGEGTWLRDGPDFVYFSVITAQGDLLGVTRYQFDQERQLVRLSHAQRASYAEGRWQLDQVAATWLTAEQSQSEQLAQQAWPSTFTPALLQVLALKPDRLSAIELYRYAVHLDQQRLESAPHWLAFWKRLFQPAATLALVLIGISFVFGPLRELTMETRVFAGIAVGVVFHFVQNILGPASIVFQFSPIWAAALPPLLCLLFALRWLRRAG